MSPNPLEPGMRVPVFLSIGPLAPVEVGVIDVDWTKHPGIVVAALLDEVAREMRIQAVRDVMTAGPR